MKKDFTRSPLWIFFSYFGPHWKPFALDMVCASSPGYYDAVLMDLRMPKMDGLETLQRIRREYPGFAAPVVALTALMYATGNLA